MNEAAFTRRAFLSRGLMMVSAATTVPAFLNRSALGLTAPLDALLLSSIAGVPEDRVLVVVQLGGGNDGLNTVVPYGMPEYYRARPTLAIRENQALKLGGADGLGLHPNLSGLMELHDDGLLAVVQGVGYPNPNRSHFTSMDIWHSADPRNPNASGWIGRYFDNQCNGTPTPDQAVSLGSEAPRALIGDRTQPVNFQTPELFRWIGEDLEASMKEPYERLNRSDESVGGTDDSQLAFLTRTSLDAQVSSERIREAVRQRPLVAYPRNPLAQQLQMVAAMIRAGLSTRVYYTTLGGFDTHSQQAGAHANLMESLGSSLRAFQQDLKAQGNDGRVLTMTFSEFGRRVGENGSRGTDHGTAAPMFLMGSMVKPGVLNRHPSLSDLAEGDLRYTTDFRSVYAAVLEDWLKCDSQPVLGGRFEPAPVLRLRS